MTTPILKIKVLPKTVIKGKMDVRFPGYVVAVSPILLDKTGGVFTFSLDVNALQDSLTSFIAGLITPVQRVVTAAGTVTVNFDDSDIIIIKKTVGEATTVNLPQASVRKTQVRTAIRIVDGKYDGATNNITIVPNGSDTIMGGASYLIDSNGASITLTPLSDGSGWI